MSLSAALKGPFLNSGKIDKPLLALFAAINLLVFTNSIFHNPEIGYDGKSHLLYIRVLPYRLPSVEDTREFFSPPLPYVLPSLFDEACQRQNSAAQVPGRIDDCLRSAGKAAQIFNVFLSLGTSFLLIKIAGVIRPGSRFMKFSTLGLLGTMTVYYKTFSQVRGEPYVVFFTIWAIYLVSKMIHDRQGLSPRSGITLGIILGLLGLSRQWGFMLYPAVYGILGLVWLSNKTLRWQVSKSLVISLAVAFLACSWFYLHLYLEYGSFLAFNRPPRAFSILNQPTSFYFGTGLNSLALFRTPTSGYFNNQFFPILYSDLWGDYWGYFAFVQDRPSLSFDRSPLNVKEKNGNREIINPYLGRVNVAALFPSFIFFAGILTGAASCRKLRTGDQEEKQHALFNIFLLVYLLVSFALYLYFLIIYTMTDQDSTNKATYMLHALIILPLLGAEFLEIVRQRKKSLYYTSMAVLGLVVVHNIRAMITHYRIF